MVSRTATKVEIRVNMWMWYIQIQKRHCSATSAKSPVSKNTPIFTGDSTQPSQSISVPMMKRDAVRFVEKSRFMEREIASPYLDGSVG